MGEDRIFKSGLLMNFYQLGQGGLPYCRFFDHYRKTKRLEYFTKFCQIFQPSYGETNYFTMRKKDAPSDFSLSFAVALGVEVSVASEKSFGCSAFIS